MAYRDRYRAYEFEWRGRVLSAKDMQVLLRQIIALTHAQSWAEALDWFAAECVESNNQQIAHILELTENTIYDWRVKLDLPRPPQVLKSHRAEEMAIVQQAQFKAKPPGRYVIGGDLCRYCTKYEECRTALLQARNRAHVQLACESLLLFEVQTYSLVNGVNYAVSQPA